MASVTAGLRPRRATTAAPLLVLTGAAGAALGLLPWLLSGLRLPLQNLWAVETLPEDMPLALLPLSQYRLDLQASLFLIGAAAAGLAARALARRRGRTGRVLLGVGGGWLAVMAIAAIQSCYVLWQGLGGGSGGVAGPAALYLTVIVAFIVGLALVGFAVLALCASAPVPGAAVGAVVAAVLVPAWTTALLVPVGTVASGWPAQAAAYTQWIAPVLVGLALAWCGVRSLGRVLAWVVGLAVLWALPAAVTGVQSAAGSRVLAGHPAEMAAVAQDVFLAALGPAGGTVERLLVALGVGIAGLLVLRRRGR